MFATAAGVLRKAALLSPAVVAFNDWVYGHALVHGASMQPTLNPAESSQADRLLIDKWSVKVLHKYQRGQVVLLRSPSDPDLLILKRLIGLEGDWVVVPDHADIETVPQGHCWIEGDNPASSVDSRTAYGSVPLGLIQGRASCIIWPPERVTWIKAQAPTNRLLMTNQHALDRPGPPSWWSSRR